MPYTNKINQRAERIHDEFPFLGKFKRRLLYECENVFLLLLHFFVHQQRKYRYHLLRVSVFTPLIQSKNLNGTRF